MIVCKGCISSQIFFREDDLLTCKKQKKNNNYTKAQGKIIDNISLALMKQFNLFLFHILCMSEIALCFLTGVQLDPILMS